MHCLCCCQKLIYLLQKDTKFSHTEFKQMLTDKKEQPYFTQCSEYKTIYIFLFYKHTTEYYFLNKTVNLFELQKF